MLSFIAVIHVIIAILLVAFVLFQDSKGGGGLFGGGTSSSILGATGGASLLVKITRWIAVLFAGTCIALTVMTSRPKKSVVEDHLPSGSPTVAPPPSNPKNQEGTPTTNGESPAENPAPAPTESSGGN